MCMHGGDGDVDGVPVEFEKYAKRSVGMVQLEESSKLAVHTEQPFAVEVLAMEKSAVKKRRQDKAKRGHKEDDRKSVMGKDPMSK